jgi:nucleotide-binding universal stress UspA family protein
MLRKLLVAHDGSAWGERALKAGLELAKRCQVDLAMICVEEVPNFPASIDEVEETVAEEKGIFDKAVEKARTLAAAEGVALKTHVASGHPVPAIVEYIKAENVDLLIVGYMGHSALFNRLIGGTTVRLVEHAPCKVMVVK